MDISQAYRDDADIPTGVMNFQKQSFTEIYEETLNNYSEDEIEFVDIDYKPRPFQAELHERLSRWNVLVCHRRFGKTVFSIMELIDNALRCEHKNPQYAYIAPTYGQAKKVAWAYIKDFCSTIPNAKANETELYIRIPRTYETADGQVKTDSIKIMLLGAENPDSLRGIYLDGCILDEYAQCHPAIWGQIIRPALSDRKGWAIFIGTPKGHNHFKELVDNAFTFMNDDLQKKGSSAWYAAIYKASETGVVDEEELLDARRTMTEDEYNQEYECDFSAALQGAYYSKYMMELERKGRIIDFDYDSSIPCHTAWDLGVNDSTVIWVYQTVGREIRILDCIHGSGFGLEWYVKELNKRPYHYTKHVIPHDGKARELGTGKTRQEILYEMGIHADVLERQAVDDGIQAVRMLLGKNIWFHRTNCKMGIKALMEYQRTWDAKKAVYSKTPLHNWCSDYADAFRYLALSIDLPERLDRMQKLQGRQLVVYDYDEFSL